MTTKPAPWQIPAGCIRLSVILVENLYTVDVEVEKVGQSLQELEDYAEVRFGDPAALRGNRGTVRGYESAASLVCAAARERDNPGMIQVVCVGVLWMALNHPTPELAADAREKMKRLILRDGGVWFTAAADDYGLDWVFSVEPMALARLGEAAMPWPRRPDDTTVQ